MFRPFGFAIDAVQDWEQHRRTPDRTARILLKAIEREPDAVTAPSEINHRGTETLS